MNKKTIISIVIGLGLALTGSVAYAAVLIHYNLAGQSISFNGYNASFPYTSPTALDPLEVPTQKVYSKALDTSKTSITKFTDGSTTCYILGTSISCVK
jgi:hypothetical protein